MSNSFKHRLYEVLDEGHAGDRLSRGFDLFMLILIVLNIVAVVIETVESIGQAYVGLFFWFEIFSVAAFTVEYLARLWVCTEHVPLRHHGPIGARLRFAVGPYAVIDFLAVFPFYLSLFVPLVDLRILRIFRLIRLLKLARYSPAMATLGRVLYDERRALLGALFIMLGLLILSSTAMYYAERFIQPDKFASIPDAMWWGLATLTTVGYGDVTPVTSLGKFIGMIVMVFGLGMFALPVAIIASGFSSEIHRRDFVVTWGMVARVPLFAGLNAASVARVTNLLQSRVVPAETVIVRRGDSADCMYFIVSGKVAVEVPPEPVVLDDGDYFGEIALLRKGERTATVRSITRVRMLVLEATDFRELIEADSGMRDAVTEVADERLSYLEKHTAQGQEAASV